MEIKIKTVEEFHDQHVSLEIRAERGEVGGLVASLLSREKVDGEVSGSMTAEEAANVLDQADRAGRVPALERRVVELEADLERYRRAHVCSDRCEPQAHVAMEGRKLVVELETDLARGREATALALNERDRLARRIAELERSLAVSLGREQTAETRADENREWAKRAEAKLAETLTALEESRALVRQRDAIIDQYVKDLMESRKFRAKEREEARQKIEALTHQLDRVRVAVRGLTLDQVVVSYVDHDEYQVRHMARRLRRIRAVIGHCEPEAEQDTEA